MWCILIPVLSRDGQSIPRSRDTLTGGGCVGSPSRYYPRMMVGGGRWLYKEYAHPGTIPDPGIP